MALQLRRPCSPEPSTTPAWPDRAAPGAGAEDAGQGSWASSTGKKTMMAVTGLLMLLYGSTSAACGRWLPRPPGLDPVTIKAFLAFGMLLDYGAALQVAELDEPWAEGVRTRIRPGLFDHVATGTAR